MTGLPAWLAVVFAAIFAGGVASAQDNASCDAACNVPCYFGECAPAKASYSDALEKCDIERLRLVGQLYKGTASGDKARAAVETLQAEGFAVSRIRASPNSPSPNNPSRDCVAIVEGLPDEGGSGVVADPCALVDVPPGWRCTVEGGRARLSQRDVPAPPPAAFSPPVALADPCSTDPGVRPSNARCVVENGQAVWLSTEPSADTIDLLESAEQLKDLRKRQQAVRDSTEKALEQLRRLQDSLL